MQVSSYVVEPTTVIVCVPARNEEERIGRLLGSLAAQTIATSIRPLRVVVVVNNTTDRTADIVRNFDDPRLTVKLLDVTLAPDKAHVGTARGLAMDAAVDWLIAEGLDDGVLISTDADAIAPTTWVEASLTALKQADLVGGRLVIAETETTSRSLADLHERIERYWAAVRALEETIDPPLHDPAPRHGDHTGASLALRASLYRAVGGVPAIPAGEDNALVSAVVHKGGRVRHCPDVWIEVSAREVGRAGGGMAEEMTRRRETSDEAAPYCLPSAAFWHAHFQRRAAWRAEWSPNGNHPNAIAYVAHREAVAPPPQARHVSVDEATADLENMVASMRPACV